MINLLPSDMKAELRAAVVNVTLLNLVFGLIFVLALTATGFGGGLYITLHDKQLADQDKEAALQEAVRYTKTKTAATNFSNDLTSAKTILASQVSYTSLIIELGNALPKGTRLTSINLTADGFGKPVTLAAEAVSYDAALALKTSLSEKKLTTTDGKPGVPLFSNVGIVDVQDNDALGSSYKLKLNLSAIITAQPPTINESGTQ